jgi:ATP-dependent Clp protease adaptor protein ClpS
MNEVETIELELIDEVITDITLEAKVIVYNDEWHSFEEVIRQIIRAVHCSPKRAEALTNQIHFKGKATVYEGGMEDCLFVSAVLEEINLTTAIEI